ncbi:hypothetical protein IGI04_028128 [Brassica rapa subsp. trilocularis]|uniref:DUF4283 domain-containing protein n=1 Tax=Brassica rapa subsp. trilocularis TaxID=1813537 RepID=A0ABQ7L4V3_BRACM|nr:hypothetical protein IGI04_028128 [Brassica rapa subsp. trilocularis]
MRASVLQRRYWHIADIPLVVNEWSPDTALDPPDLSAMPIWIDLKGVPSLLFSHKALKCLSRAAGKFVKLHPYTERCTRLDVARVLVEVNLNKPLVEKISCLDKDGATVMIEVCYPWLPPKCNVCNAWGHQGSNCKRITVLQKDKEVEVPKEDAGVSDVVINGDGTVRYDLNTNRNVVTELLQELEGLPPALGSNIVGDISREAFEKGNTSCSDGLEAATQDWAVVGRIDPNLVTSEVPKAVESLDGVQGQNDVLISPSRFSVLALEGIGEDVTNEEEELEEGEVIADLLTEDTKLKDPARTGRFRPGPSLKLSKQLPARSKDLRLKTLKYDMRLLNKTHYGDLPARTKEAFEEMCRCQNMVLLDPNPLLNLAGTFEASVVVTFMIYMRVSRIFRCRRKIKGGIRFFGNMQRTLIKRSSHRLAGSLCGRRINPDWSLTLQFVTNNNLQLMDKILLKMVFQTCVYYMWKERNERRHQRGFRTVDQAIRIVDKAIRNRISSLRYGPVHRFAGLLQRWFEVFDRP